MTDFIVLHSIGESACVFVGFFREGSTQHYDYRLLQESVNVKITLKMKSSNFPLKIPLQINYYA